MTNIQKFPAGLIDNNVELFSFNEEPMAIHMGQTKNLLDLPCDIINLIDEDLISNEPAYVALDLAGYTTKEAKLKKYAVCRFGNLDNTPDIQDGKLTRSEYYNCGFRGECPMEGIVCSSLWVNGRVLSPFETEMIKELATELTLPAIASNLKISLNNFETRKKVLFEKLKVQTRAGMVAAAYQNQILIPVSCSA